MDASHRLSGTTHDAARLALDTLEHACEQRVMHTELDCYPDQFPSLQVCQERNAGTLVICERAMPHGISARELTRCATELVKLLDKLHPLTT